MQGYSKERRNQILGRKLNNPVFLITRSYHVAGQLAGLIVISVKRPFGAMARPLLVDEEGGNPGYLIHPRAAAAHCPIVVTRDLKWWLQTSFAVQTRADTINPMVTAIDLPGCRTQSSQILQNRPTILWNSGPGSRDLFAASRLGSLISSYGQKGDEGLSLRCFSGLNPYSLFKSLKQHSTALGVVDTQKIAGDEASRVLSYGSGCQPGPWKAV